ncbi:MAG: YfhO family protein [Chitinophagaceae bacterium]|nr:YfhO family protein [Chitinophagaceae bacterium]
MKQFQWKSLLPHAIAVGIFLLVAIIFCKPALEGKVIDQSDVSHWKGMAQDLFDYKETHGHYPLWNNNLFGGMPAYQIAMEAANPITPIYFHQLFMLFMGKPIGFFFLLCISLYFLSQVIGAKPWIGILGGIAYAYATYDPIIIAVGHDTKMQAMGYMPALLGALWLIYKKQYWWGAALTALFSFLLIAMNHLQVTYYFLFVAGFMTIGFMIQWIKEKDYRHMGIALALALSMGALGVGPNIVSLATTSDYAKATMRGGSIKLDSTGQSTKSKGLDIDYAFYYGSYGIAETYTFLVPGIYGGSSNGELDANSHFAKRAIEKGIPEDQATQFAGAMPTYWGPQPMTAGPVYLGAVICFLFIFGLVYLKTWHRWWILSVCVLAMIMSWGSHLMAFNSFLFNNLPLYNKFRAPSIILILPQLLFPLLAMMALQQFLFEEKNKATALAALKKTVYVTGGIILGAILLYLTFDYIGKDDQIKNYLTQSLGGNQEEANGFYNALKDDRRSLFGSDLLRSILFIAITAGLLWLFIKDKLKTSYVLLAIVALSSIDLFTVGKRYLNEKDYRDAEVVNESQFAATPIDQEILKDTTQARVLNLTVDPYTDAFTAYHHRSVGGYHPAKLSIYNDLINFQLNKQPMNMSVLNMLNTKYFIVPNQQTGQPELQVNPSALGHAWFVKGIRYEKDAAAVMKAMDQFSPSDTAIVESVAKKDIPVEPVADSTASIVQVLNDNDLIRYRSTSSSNQFAVFSEIFYDRGWTATIDGKEVPIVKVNYVLRGLSVPAGNHEIVFEFKPASYYNSTKIAVITSAPIWILLILASFFSLRRKREEKV